MIMNELVGKQIVSFKNDKGELIEGVKLHFLCQDDRVSGKCANTQFINATSALYQKAVDMPFGDFNFMYGPKGRILDIILPSSGK